MGEKFRILSIDGGGIRGIIPAKYLQLIEEKIGARLHTYFDLVVGSSTGGIIALAIGAGIPMGDIVDLYKEKGKKIFRKRTRFLLNYPPFFLSKYSNKTLSREVGRLFGDRTISDSLVRLCIPSINITSGKPTIFKTQHTGTDISDEESRYERDHQRFMRDVAMATSSAPLYFPVFTMDGVGRYVDGGLWANNPSVIGIAEAVKLGFELKNIELLSIGTGESMFNETRISKNLSGFAGWKSRIVDLTFLSQSQGANFTAQYLLKPENYRRITSPLPVNFKLDTTSEMDRYLAYSEELFRNTVSDIHLRFFTNAK